MTTAATTETTKRRDAIARAFTEFTRFCGLLQIRPKSEDLGETSRRIPMALTPIQRAYNDARTARDIILKPRQVFVTTLECSRDLWWFLTKPGARVVVVCQSQTDQAAIKDVSEKFRIFFDSLQRLGLSLEFGRQSATEWTLPKRDATLRLIQAGASEASASKKGRGGTVNRLHITEAAFFERAEDTFNSLLESVPRTGSEVVNESTPNGASGFYYRQWRLALEGKSAYKPHFFSWWLHPEYRMPVTPPERSLFQPRNALERSLLERGVSIECLAWYRWKLADKGGNEQLVAQEFPSDPASCFLLTGRGFFDGAEIDRQLLGAERHPPIETAVIRQSGAYGQVVEGVEVPALRIWHHAAPGRSYVIAVDTSEGAGGDAGAAVVLERGTGRHMATLWGQFKPWEIARHAVTLAKRYGNAWIAVERNNHGSACLRALEAEYRWPAVFSDRDGKPGWLTSEVSRAPALDAFEQAFRSKGFSTLDPFLLSEMRTMIVTDRGRAEAGSGSHDDLVMATAIGWDVICRPVARTRSGEALPVA